MKSESTYKIKFNFNPVMQCITGKFDGYLLVLEAYNNKDLYTYDKTFTYNKSNYNALVKHIINNRVYTTYHL